MKKLLTLIAASLIGLAAFAQQQLVTWSSHVEKMADDTYRVIFTGKVAPGYHTYTLTDEFSATELMDVTVEGGELDGAPYELGTPVEEVDEFGELVKHYTDEIIIAQNIKLDGTSAVYAGTIFTNACTGGACKAEYYDFEVEISPKTAVAAAGGIDEPEEKKGSIWGLIIEAILWGFAMLLTPCVFPMVPMTVSFFMKGSENVAAGRFKAAMYGLFIVLLYTVPISVIIMLTRIIGGDAVTADIFNWLSTHWLPNIIFFIVFMIFAASFFGAFEITLPSSLVNKSDAGAEKGGLMGIFFMALTLVLVSFSCTGPIVGSVVINSMNGGIWMPIITMTAFAVAFALPFTLLAWFPSMLKNMPKSGGWLNSVKVVLGFVEVALGLKFLMTADQTYHWGILDREIYLAIWIVVFTLLGLYLLGKLRFAHDDKMETISVKRLFMAILVFSFVVYMIPGMFGAPLNGISGYLPPMSSQDFRMDGSEKNANVGVKYGDNLHLPHGLKGYFDLDEAVEAAKKQNKPIFVDVTGHACNNCREMETRVWSDTRVKKILSEDYIICALYVDDRMELAEEDYYTNKNGKVLTTLGRKNNAIAVERFNVNAQPGYVLLSPDEEILMPVRGYDDSIEGFIEFLEGGKAKM